MRTLILGSLLLAGCMGPAFALKKQVAFDQKCPEERVRIIEWGPLQESADVNACGKPLSYHAEIYGVTDTSPGQANWVQSVR